MYLKNLLSLSGSGIFLIVSNTPWFFNNLTSKSPNINVISAPNTVNQIPEEDEEEDQEFNLVESEDTQVRTGKAPAFNYTRSKYSSIFLFTSKSDPSQKHLMYPPNKTLDFTLYFSAYEYNYSSVKKSEIKIRLFTKPAWETENMVEEYGRQLSTEEVAGLFGEEQNELKTKQLLLSISAKRNWQKHASRNNETGAQPFISENNSFVRSEKVDELRDLKIKYFREYEDLKNYVKNKVESCKDDKKACVAKAEELDIPVYDKLSYYQEEQ